MTTRSAQLLLLLLLAATSAAKKLATKPPRGWRSWIAFTENVTQVDMEAAIDALHKKRDDGISLLDLGYGDVAVDGGWSNCTGVNNSNHDHQGQIIIDDTKFPDFAAMNRKAHAVGITSSWYLNCDTCLKPRPPLYRPAQSLTESAFTETWYANDAKRAVSLGFDGVKFDTQPGGPNWNISKWAEALAATGKDFLIEDCLDKHPDGTALSTNKPGWLHPKIDILHHPEYCPFSFYRTGGDNFPNFLVGMSHTLVDLAPFLNNTGPVPASRPGCWAYPDMLSIGQSIMAQGFIDSGCPALTETEERTLFATWAIVSSPLILSFNVSNDAEVKRLWPIIANKQALSINEQWAGEAGRLLKTAPTSFNTTVCSFHGKHKAGTYPSWAVWSKRLTDPPNSVAVLAINVAETAQSFEITYDDLIDAAGVGGEPHIRGKKTSLVGTEVWTGKKQKQPVNPGGAWHVDLPESHSSAFVIFSPKAASQ